MTLARICRAVIGVGLCLAGPVVAVAAVDCDNAQDQASLNECAGEDYKAADAKLDDTYKKVTARLADLAEVQSALTKAQGAWLAYRDAECGFVASGVAGGSAYPMILSYCLAGVTDVRVQELEGFLRCEEGDLSCPVPLE